MGNGASVGDSGINVDVLLIGLTDQGKGELSKFLLGKGAMESVVQELPGDLSSLKVRCINTPDIQKNTSAEKIATDLKLDAYSAQPVILYVVSAANLLRTPQDEMIQFIQQKGLWPQVIPIFTNVDEIPHSEDMTDRELEQKTFILAQKNHKHSPEPLKTLLDKMNDKFIVVESANTDKMYREEKIKEIHQLVVERRHEQDERKSSLPDHTNAPNQDDCFPEDSTVTTKNGTKMMKDLQIGNKVLCITKNGKTEFSEVIAYLHYEPTQHARYLAMDTEQGTVTISANHIIFTTQNTTPEDGQVPIQPKFAAIVKEGDFIISASSDQSQPIPLQVNNIRSIWKRGIYAPLTKSGVILVDGALASCYASFYSHTLAHGVFAPLRLFKKVSHHSDKQPRVGIHTYALFLHKLVSRLSPQSFITHSEE